MREQMILDHLPLARRLALRYSGGLVATDDLVQVASVGLIKAVDRWDPERGVSFAAFAMPTILGELRRHFRDHTWDVRPPRPLLELSFATEKARTELQRTLEREPTVGDLAERLGRAPEEIVEALDLVHVRRLASLDEPRPAPGREDREYEHAESRATLARVTRILDDRAREIVRLHYEDDLPQSEIAIRLGVSPMSVSRILRASLEKLAACLTPASAPAGA